MADPSRRMLQLLSLLQNGRAWTGEELSERLETSPRTLRRDIDRLRDLGYPVRAPRGRGGHYRLVAGAAMPPLLVEDDEAVAIAIGLQLAGSGTITGLEDSAATALRKVEQVLPMRLRRRVTALDATTESVPDSWPAVSAEAVDLIGTACHRHRRLTFTYRDREGDVSERRVEPYRQVLTGRRWYLLAWDLERVEWRTFRIDRVTAATMTSETFTPRDLPADDAATFIKTKLATFPPRHKAVVTFHASISTVAGLLSGDSGALRALPGNRCLYTTYVDSYEWLSISLGILGVDYDISEPADFRAYSRQLAARIAASAGAST